MGGKLDLHSSFPIYSKQIGWFKRFNMRNKKKKIRNSNSNAYLNIHGRC